MKPLTISKKVVTVLWICLIFLLILLLRRWVHHEYRLWWIFLSVNFAYLCFKLFFSLFTNWRIKNADSNWLIEQQPTVAVIVPYFNEDFDTLLTVLKCIAQQTYPVHEIVFVDDGSDDLTVYNQLQRQVPRWWKKYPDISLRILRQPENLGKKAAQILAFKELTSEFVLLLDSDGEISDNAVADMLLPFEDAKTGAVVGKIQPRNFAHNFLTRMQDIVYSNAFQLGRRAQSYFGTVIVCSGALSMYRLEIVLKNLELFSRERFLGIRCVTGDDRLLTLITMKEGLKTLYRESAVCWTDVPTRVSKYLRQQIRWQKSGLLFTLFSFKTLYKRILALIFQVLEQYLWLINLLIFLYLYFFENFRFTPLMIFVAIIYTVLVYYLTCIYYSRKNLLWYLLGFVLNFVYGFLLMFIRVYALCTIGISKWYTR
ncbi:glycosyltransferase [Enterococcus sp. LJL90]